MICDSDGRSYFVWFRPNNIEDYIHRIGRTGRAGATGVAVSFFTEKHSKLAKELIDILRTANQNIPPQLQAFVPQHHGRGGGGRGGGAAPYYSAPGNGGGRGGGGFGYGGGGAGYPPRA